MEAKMLENLLNEGLDLLEQALDADQASEEALDSMFHAAKARAFGLVREALGLTEAEFMALMPCFVSAQRDELVILKAYHTEMIAVLCGFEFLPEHGDEHVRIALKIEGRSSHGEALEVSRNTVAMWLAQARDEAMREEMRRVMVMKDFEPFAYYRVWYGDNWDYDYYDLRWYEANEHILRGKTVDDDKMVRVWRPRRFETINVETPEDLPAWCPAQRATVMGREIVYRTTPDWARG